MSKTQIPPPPQWVLDLNTTPSKPKHANTIPDPPGYLSTKTLTGSKKTQSITARQPPTPEETDTLKLKKSWEVALAPAKQLPMQAIMGYMSGNSLQIFSIMMVFMLFKGPLQSIAQTREVFSRYETEKNRGQMIGVKALYVVTNCLLLALGVYKVHSMGLLPTTRSDWLAWEYEREPLERVYFPR